VTAHRPVELGGAAGNPLKFNVAVLQWAACDQRWHKSDMEGLG